MKRVVLTLFVFALAITGSSAVTGISGNFNVGAGQFYTSLTNDSVTGFFKFLNSIDGVTNVISGPITVTITSDMTIETGAVALHALHYDGRGPYVITIVPNGITTRTISGFNNGTKGLIDFNGAANVTIDGRYNNAGNYLLFKNNAGGGSYADFTFEGDANNITLKYCTMQGSPLNSTIQSGPGYNGSDPAFIFIGNGVSTGNHHITLDHNNIGDGYVDQCFIANSTTVNNHDITVTNNNIFNFIDGGYTTNNYGMYITQSGTGAGSNWNISGNSFYETGIADGAYSTEFIYFHPGTSSIGDTINGNYLGGNLPLCAAGSLPAPGYFANSACCSSSFVSNLVDVNCSSIAISNNVIKNIRFTGGYAPLVLLNITGSTSANISGNQFGDSNASLCVQTSGLNATVYLVGVYNQSSGVVNITGNQFLNLYEVSGTGNTNAIFSTGSSSNSSISNNIISGCKAYGYYSGSPINDASSGIYIYPFSNNVSNLLIQGNTIQIPSITGNSGDDAVGIYLTAGSFNIGGQILDNRITDGRMGAGTFDIGIYSEISNGGNANYSLTFANNQISLSNPSGTGTSNLQGIRSQNCIGTASAATENYFYNSVYIGGTGSGSSFNTLLNSCFYYDPCSSGGQAGNTLSLKNNIFINARSGNYNFAIANVSSTSFTSSTSDYNLFLGSNATYQCYWGTSISSTSPPPYPFSTWVTNSGGDAHSINPTYNASSSTYSSNILDPSNLFVNITTGNLHISTGDGESYQFVAGQGTPVAITTDYDTTSRSSSTPDIGSDEINGVFTATSNHIYDNSLVVFPNPAHNELIINVADIKMQSAECSVMNAFGQLIYQRTVSSSQFPINISSFPAGIYFLQLKSESGSMVRKFVKE